MDYDGDESNDAVNVMVMVMMVMTVMMLLLYIIEDYGEQSIFNSLIKV